MSALGTRGGGGRGGESGVHTYVLACSTHPLTSGPRLRPVRCEAPQQACQHGDDVMEAADVTKLCLLAGIQLEHSQHGL